MSNKQSFIKGAIILIIANAVSKILGAIFKIPLTYLLHEEGMAIYNTAFNVYSMLLSFVVSGMPLAISKIIAEEYALKNSGNVKKIVTLSSFLLGILGFLGSAILWFGADFFAIAMKEQKAFYSIKVIAPSVFFVSLGTVWKSFYQGRANMTPTAISQVIEAFIKLIVGFFFAYYFRNMSIEITAAASMLGICIGEIIATFILFVQYLPFHFSPVNRARKTNREIFSYIFSVTAPAVIAAVISSFLSLVDITVIRRCLEQITFTPESLDSFLRLYAPFTTVFDKLPETLKLGEEGTRWLFGAYSGYALTVFHLPIGILATLGVSILPIISGSLAVKNFDSARSCCAAVSKLTLLVALPASFFIAVFAEDMLFFLFKNTASAVMLKLLSPCLIFICMSQLFNAVLNASGKIISPFIFCLVGDVIKIICSLFLIRSPQINILGAAISADISYFVVFVLSYKTVRRDFGFSFSKIFFKPLFSCIIMSIIMYSLYDPFLIIFPHRNIAFAACGAIGCISYLLMLACTKAVSKQDFAVLWHK